MHLKDYTLLVLQLCHFGAANNRDACRSRRIGPRYIGRSPQIASGPHQILTSLNVRFERCLDWTAAQLLL